MNVKDITVTVSLKDTEAFKQLQNFMLEVLGDERICESVRNEHIDKLEKLIDENYKPVS